MTPLSRKKCFWSYKLQHLKRCGAKINITGCEDYENTFARIESDCTLRFGFKVLMKSISYTKQSNLFLHFLSTSKRFSRSWGIVPCTFIACITQVTLEVINYTLFIYDRWLLLLSHSVLVQFSGQQAQPGWWCLLLGSDPWVVLSQYLLRFGL